MGSSIAKYLRILVAEFVAPSSAALIDCAEISSAACPCAILHHVCICMHRCYSAAWIRLDCYLCE